MTKIIPINVDRDYYCSNKFTFLKIDFEKQTTYNCHAAAPHPIDFSWLKQNPGQLFNTPVNVAERELMLANQRNASCEQNCYPAEDKAQVSTRMLQSDPLDRYASSVVQPSRVDFTLFSDCNLTCSYCCKEYSSAWRRDILTNGDYNLTDDTRAKIQPIDIITSKLSQNEKLKSPRINLLLEEFYKIQDNVKILTITGGEPFLNSMLLPLLKNVQQIPQIDLFTGLGVNSNRFRRMLSLVKQYKNVNLCISVESTGKNYEFNRYGMSWEKFQERLQIVKDSGIKFQIHCTISNLTAFGFGDFYAQYKEIPMHIDFVHSPEFMNAGNIDPTSKQLISKQLTPYQDDANIQKIIKTVSSEYVNNNHRVIMAKWLEQFANRRGLDLTVYPQTFLDWLKK